MRSVRGNVIDFLLDGNANILIHQQNCKHGWKAGVAKEIAARIPSAKHSDLKTKYGCKKKMGSYSYAKIKNRKGDDCYVLNLYSQFNFGRGKHTDLKALRACLKLVNQNFSGMVVCFPKIGAGHGGGDWAEITNLLSLELDETKNIYVEYDLS